MDVDTIIAEMERRGWGDRLPQSCYDFPKAVLHTAACEGRCLPLPTPVPPFSEDERSAIYGYFLYMNDDLEDVSDIVVLGATLQQRYVQ